MTVLKKGSKGEEVKKLQGYLKLYQDGVFGPLTEEAVKAFQKKYGLTPDGIVGPKTWDILTGTLNSALQKSRRNINRIIVHCTATQEGKNFTVNDVRQWHLKRGFSDIGYHYLIYLDGSVHDGRNVNISGAHTTGYNTNSIGVCYVGGLDRKGNPKDTRTDAQKEALRSLLKKLKILYPKATIHGHREFANKACPCFDAKKEYSDI